MLKSHYDNLYLYTPSLIAPIVFMSLFGIIVIVQCFRWYNAYHENHNGKNYGTILIPMFVACIFELIGLIARILGHNDKTYLITYIIQDLFLLLSPPVLAASIYMAYSRFIRLSGVKSVLIPSRHISAFFVWGDVVSFGIQGSGGGLTANIKHNIEDIGNYIIVAGLFIQIIIFGFFIVSLIMVAVSLWRKQVQHFKWRKFLAILLISSIFIFIRCIYRIVMSLEGKRGAVNKHEWPIYVFDIAAIFISSFALVLIDIANYLSKLPAEEQEIEEIAFKL